MRKVEYYILIMCVLLFFNATSQQLTPPIQNYSSLQYNAASQNWDIKVDEQGIVYAANNKGLLSFDGQRWELYPLKSGSIIRSVLPHQGKIYTGSYKEFGYWEKDIKGVMQYQSLISLLGEYELQSEEFWQILAYNDAIYFRSFGAIYKYDGKTIYPVQQVVSRGMTVFNDRLVIALEEKGLFYLEENGNLEPLQNQEVLLDRSIVDILEYRESLLICTRDGLFLYDEKGSRAFPDRKLNAVLAGLELNHLIKNSDNELVFGTVKSGILHYNEGTGEIASYSRNEGLQNNTVLAMTQKNGKVWLGLDNGIDAIHLDSPIKFYTDDSGELGSVYDLAFHRDEVYLASNTGVYKLEEEDFKLLPDAEGHSWNLEAHNNVLYSNHNSGTYKIINDDFVPIDVRTGSFEIVPIDREQYLIGSYTGIDFYDDELKQIKRLNGINFPVKQLLFENPGTLWAADAYEGIYRIGINQRGDSTTFVKKVSADRQMGNYSARIFKINGQIAVLTNEKWYRYNVFTDGLELLREWHEFNGNRLLAEDNGLYWFINSAGNTLKITDFKGTELVVSSKMLNNRTVKDHERLVKRNDSIYYITLHDGFARLNLHELYSMRDNEYLSTPVIQELYDVEQNYDLTATPHISSKNAREVTVLAGLPVSDAIALKYELIGSDSEPVVGEVVDGVIRFQNLPHDEYKLQLSAVSSQNADPVLTSFRFVVDPPWYLQNYMKFMYVLLLFGVLGLIFWINRIKLQKHRRLLRLKYQQEHEERMNNLEKERLIHEITMKRKELANSTMMAAKKNEVLMEIQGELNKDRNKFSNEYRLKHIMSKINRAIKDKDEWKVFETNFNELHEDFFKDLLEKYPNLSNKDLKLCSYLKMNLTSKEIAPLMGISVRGVEVHRYRLRKKMNLDSSENLTNFLIANF